MKKRIWACLLTVCMMAGMLPLMAFAAEADAECEHSFDGTAAVCVDQICTVCGETVPGSAKHDKPLEHEGKEPTYLESGWMPYVTCETCGYTSFTALPVLEPSVETYEEFVYYLEELEGLAWQFARENPGKDPVALVIKYIRTGVDRYNSGSWGIMAGYEDVDFANYVRRAEADKNKEVTDESDLYQVTGLKNIEEFELPNGDEVDFGHMFGTMDISYHNKGSQNHADVGGWAGDLVDLMTSSDRAYGGYEESTVHLDLPEDLDLETMVKQVGDNIFLQATCPDDKFTRTDFYGDIDGMYIVNELYKLEYEAGDMADIISGYCTKSLSDEDRAAYFMKVRLGNSGTRAQVRAAVYEEYSGNNTITTLESTREWLNDDSAYLTQLRRAVCYAYADYVCMLAGDYVESGENPYYTDFSTEISQLSPGVTQEIRKATSADGKQMVYYLATADLSNPYVTVNANYYDDEPTEWAMERVLDQANTAQAKYGDPESEHYIENYQIVAAINSDGFDMTTGAPGGLLVMHGQEYHSANSSGFFGMTLDGKPVIGTTAEYNTIYKGKLRDAVGAFGTTLVKEGKVNITATSNYYTDRASRTAVGITKTGKVVFMVLDGRQEPVSCGGSMIEIAQIMLEAGCVEAINLDGGGSTTFVSKPEGQDELQVTNKPSDGYARSVSSTLIMVSTAPSSTAFDHAIIESDYSYATAGTEVQLTAVGVSATGNVAEMPEGYTWAVSNERLGSVTEDGVFTGLRNGSVDVYLKLDDEIIGSKTMTMVVPSSVYFTRKTMNGVYGSTINLPVAALYEGKNVAISEDDITLTVSPEAAGTCDGFKFTANESEVKNALITATLNVNTSVSGTITVNLYKQGENSFDFEKADGGDSQLAWVRQVSNSVFDSDTTTYTAVDHSKDMTTSYIFAVDMSQITIPDQLSELVYMLPGHDDPNASAWNFLLQLAERISVLTEVSATVQVDERFDVDISELKIINEYFEVVNKETDIVYNEETNEITMTLHWKDQTTAIDAATANPLCIINGIKITPKEGTFDTAETIQVISSGKMGYKVFLRTSTLYSFCLKPENQEKYGLLPFQSTYHDGDGVEKPENGGYFTNTEYKTFNDYYYLSYAMKQGWIKEPGGWAYYVDDERLTGVQLIDGFYYDLGEEGVRPNQQEFTGIFTGTDGGMHYVRTGVIVTSGWIKENGVGYHCHSDGYLHEATIYDPTDCITGGHIRYVCNTCQNTPQIVGSKVYPEGHSWDHNYTCRSCGYKGQNIEHAIAKFGSITGTSYDPPLKQPYYGPAGLYLSFFVTFDGETELTRSTGASLNDDDTMRDLYISYINPKGIGKAAINIQGKGNCYGEVVLEYTIYPCEVKKMEATLLGEDSVLLEWIPGGRVRNGVLQPDGADSYHIYEDTNGNGKLNIDRGDTLIADVKGTSCIVNNLDAGKHTYFVVARADSDNGDENGLNYNSPASKAPSASVTVTNELPDLEEPVYTPDETVEDKAEIEVTFNDEPETDGSWSVIVVAYDENGMMVSVNQKVVTGTTLKVALENLQSADRLEIYVVGDESRPLMAPGVIEDLTAAPAELELLSMDHYTVTVEYPGEESVEELDLVEVELIEE